MQVFYKPNKAIKGAAISFKYGLDNSIYIELVKQTGWDNEKGVGTFKDGDKIRMKFEMIEAAKFIACYRFKDKFSFFHDSQKGKTSGNFGPYIPGEGKPDRKNHFTFSVNSNPNEGEKVSIGLLFSPEEMELVRIWLEEAIRSSQRAAQEENDQRIRDSKKD